MREIKAEEAYRLYDCLEALGEHHNKVSVYFKGHYPTITSKDLIKEFEKKLREGRSFIAVVEDGEKIIGFCMITVEGSEGTLDYLSILEPERGKGHGTALMDWAFRKFDELGVGGIEVKVVYGNDVIDLYRRYDFKEKSIILCKSQ